MKIEIDSELAEIAEQAAKARGITLGEFLSEACAEQLEPWRSGKAKLPDPMATARPARSSASKMFEAKASGPVLGESS
jgi:hypothetical protein